MGMIISVTHTHTLKYTHTFIHQAYSGRVLVEDQESSMRSDHGESHTHRWDSMNIAQLKLIHSIF